MTNSTPNKIAKQEKKEATKGREVDTVALEKSKGKKILKMKEEKDEEKKDNEVIFEAVNFALEQLNLDSSKEIAVSVNQEEVKSVNLPTRRSLEVQMMIPKVQLTTNGKNNSIKLKSGSNLLNLIQTKRSPLPKPVTMSEFSVRRKIVHSGHQHQQRQVFGKQIPKLEPLARQEDLMSKPGANHLNLIQVRFKPREVLSCRAGKHSPDWL